MDENLKNIVRITKNLEKFKESEVIPNRSERIFKK